MSDLPLGLDRLLEAPELEEALSGKRAWILALDYDGTLAPLRPERDQAFPYAGVRDVLDRLPVAGPSRLVLISGREADHLSRLLGLVPMPETWGCHGAQRTAPGGTATVAALTVEQEQALERARSLADDPRVTEVKPCGVAFHWRGLAPQARERLETVVAPRLSTLAEASGLELRPFDGGLELRLPGYDKGAAIRTLMAENPQALVVFLGDDLTDEDAFLALGEQGIGVLVRGERRPTAAKYWITPPQELLVLLGRFAGRTLPYGARR